MTTVAASANEPSNREVAVALAGQVGPKGVVKSSAQDAVEPVAAAGRAVEQMTTLRGLGKHECRPGALVGHAGELGQQVAGACIEDGVGGVEPQAVEPGLIEPVADVLAEEQAHRAPTAGPS